MRVEAEIVAVLEGAGLALVGIHRHQPRALLGAHELPLAAGREACAAKPAQARVADDLDQVVARARAAQDFAQEAIAAGGHVVLEVNTGLERMRVRVGMRELGDRAFRRLHHLHVRHRADRRAVAGAHAGRAHDAHVRTERPRQILQQPLGAGHRAGQRVADPHRDGGRRLLALLHHVEMRVEGRDLVHLGLRELHLGRERSHVRGGNVPVFVLDQMQMLDQEIAAARAIDQQRLHLRERLRIDLATLGRAARLAPARRRAVAAGPRGILDVHCSLRRPRLEPIQGAKQSRAMHRTIGFFYRNSYDCPGLLQCGRWPSRIKL